MRIRMSLVARYTTGASAGATRVYLQGQYLANPNTDGPNPNTDRAPHDAN